jgi:hypothetical protein
MSEHCTQDGGFIGQSGCTHPNHQHSDLVKSLLGEELPRMITSPECDIALKEGFFVQGANGKRIGFGLSLDRHLNQDHVSTPKDIENRKKRLMYAVFTVKNPDKIEHSHKGIVGRTAYIKSFDSFGIMALTDEGGENIEYVFNIIPKRNLKKGLPHQT